MTREGRGRDRGIARGNDGLLLWLLLLLLPLPAGGAGFACSTTYQPRSDGRVGLVIHHAAAMYVESGRERSVGPFSGALPELVAGNPVAAQHARTAHAQLAAGTSAYLTGAAAVAVGILALSGPPGWIVIGAGATVLGTGLGLLGAGLTHAIDAVNVYNDSVAVPGPGPGPGPSAPPAPEPPRSTRNQ